MNIFIYKVSTYDQDGNLTRQTDELGNAVRYVRDARGRVIAAVLPDGGVFTTAYDGGGRVVADTDALGNMTRYEHDLLGRVTKITDAESGETDLVYDPAGNLVSVADALDMETRHEFDNLGRLTKIVENYVDGVYNPSFTDEDVTTEFGYDADGNLVSAADPLGNTTTYEYDEIGRVTRITSADPDGLGDLTSLVVLYLY
ncbi:MAG: RHS repeat protein, partial [Pirellulaceae bacterium]|nr:RHS repeat protein [Pirellulaceae bacterium]